MNNGRSSIELFTGAGGLALGLEQSGWHHSALIEWDEHACSTIHLNESLGHPLTKGWRLFPDDVRTISYLDLSDHVDMVAGGPPCQPFSLGGKHRAYQDKRDMFPEAVRAVRELRPKCFVFENVKGLLRQTFSSYFNYIILQLSYPMIIRKGDEDWQSHLSKLERHHTGAKEADLSYRVVYRLLDAAEYGVSQHRHRVFIVGFRSDLQKEWSFPEPTHSLDRLLWDQWVSGEYWEEHRVPKSKLPAKHAKLAARIRRLESDFSLFPPPGERCKTVRDALRGLPDPRNKSDTVPNHEFRDGARPYHGHTGSSLDLPSKALKAGDHGVPGGENMMALPDGSYRYYTVRESARLQTFPDDYVFSGSWTEAMRQIGNAVPVELAAAVGKSILKQVT
ncbi:MAG TPA: DNA cytosine methyltransferase [Syntrophales bacterium]|nr:DNA cytosine methyltransferase [Syntrophales bacterium]HOS76417.1 DNA cytosine methyltransferase [Syntrophales bacterium]HPB70486.1 DNA cytosine methyltransferase [Syntrophales bacterium]HQN25750.1 DNA cytosine methyltransferase [Syntrophales bacterium]HQP29142.1 DNA cytosine methyltransferase [Syntrophales bacterium]